MNTDPLILTEIDARGVARLTLNRPERHNALNAEMIIQIAEAVEGFNRVPAARVMVLRANGKHFSAGADISAPAGGAEAKPDLIDALQILIAAPKPSLALVQGACIGGGAGWAAACDMVLAAEDAFFSIPEVRLGFPPGPLVSLFGAAMGTRAAYRYCLSGERFSAAEALDMGLVHQVCPAGGLDAAAEPLIEGLLLGGPQAQAATRAMLREQSRWAVSEQRLGEIREESTRRRHSAEASEGKASFREKRKPNWYRILADG